jgi:hypothetical protein
VLRTHTEPPQAFFKKLRVRAESDEVNVPPRVSIAAAELTEPYAVLLSEGLAENIEAEILALREAESPAALKEQLVGALGSGWVSNYEVMAERGGFEPPNEFPRYTISSRARSTTPAPLRESGLA